MGPAWNLKILKTEQKPFSNFNISGLTTSSKIRNWNKLPRSQKTHFLVILQFFVGHFVRPLEKN